MIERSSPSGVHQTIAIGESHFGFAASDRDCYPASIPSHPCAQRERTLSNTWLRCGNVASILELDEWLGQEYKVFTHAPPVSSRDPLCSEHCLISLLFFNDSPYRMSALSLPNGHQLTISCNTCVTSTRCLAALFVAIHLFAVGRILYVSLLDSRMESSHRHRRYW